MQGQSLFDKVCGTCADFGRSDSCSSASSVTMVTPACTGHQEIITGREVSCRMCGAPGVRLPGDTCTECMQAILGERQAALDNLCRRRGVAKAEDLPLHDLISHGQEWGRA